MLYYPRLLWALLGRLWRPVIETPLLTSEISFRAHIFDLDALLVRFPRLSVIVSINYALILPG